jgi:uracil-DNA glycosylase family 4
VSEPKSFLLPLQKPVFQTLEEAQAAASSCHDCVLSQSRTRVAFARGNPQAKLMIIGEGPGLKEDETGLPFVGRGGHLLDKILGAGNIDPERDVYICNVVKCRPPGNRVPENKERDSCSKYLEAQLFFIAPKLILLAGSTAVHSILKIKDPLSRIRGKWFEYKNGAKVMPVFHPSYLLRNDSKEVGSPKWLMWQDIKEVRKQLDILNQ